MDENNELQLLEEDLKFILESDFEKVVEMAKYNSFCRNCFGEDEIEMIDYQIRLTHSNDLVFKGKCSSCSKGMSRYIEIDQQRELLLRIGFIRSQKG